MGLVSAPQVQAATRTWDGGGADNNWSTPANWSADTLPVAGDTVTFNGTSTKNATIDVPVNIAIFQMNAGYTGVVTQSNTLTLTTSYTQAAGTFTGGGAAMNVTGGTTINAGGTFNGGTSPITLNGALTVNAGGSFTSTSGTLTVTGALTLAAGVFTHNGGTVVFSTSNVTLNLGGAATFNNVQFLSGTKTLSAANTMTILATLTLTGGSVNTGTLAAQGDIAVASTFLGGSTTLLINGGGAQAWTDAFSATADLPIVNINKGGGTLTMTGTFRTTRNWTWTAGAVSAAGSTVIFAAALTVTGSHALGAVEMAGGAVTIAAGTTLTAAGTLTLTSGTVVTGTLAAQGDISAASGFTGGSATLLINGGGAQAWNGAAIGTSDLPNVNINKPGGTLTMTGTLRTTRNWTWTAGTLAAGGSTVTFAAGLTITGSHTLGAVTMAGGAVTIAAGTTLTAAGTLTLTSGTVVTGTLAAQGDISNASGFNGGSGTLLINGGGAQAWNGGAIATSDLPVVNINKPGGTLTMTGTFRTTRNWTWTAGAVAAGGSTVTFGAALTITGSHTLGAVVIAGGAVTIAAGTTLTATGTVTLTSGTLNTGTLAAQGDISASAGFTGGGSATLLINGAGAQLWTGAANTTTSDLPNVNINKPAGTLTLSGTLRTTRNWTYTAGALAVGGSTVIFASGTITGSHTLGSVEIRGGTITIAAGTTLTASGPLNLFSGGLNTGTLAAQGSVDVQIGYLGGGTATLLIDGAGAQTFTGFHTTAAGSLPNLDINKPSGTLTIAGTIRTARNWTHTAGAVNAAGSTIIFNGTQTITGSHSLDMVEIRGVTVTIAAGTTLTATGNVLLFSGSFGGTGSLAAGANVDAQSGFTGGTATLLLNGIGAQTLSQSATAASSLPVVNIAKPSGTLTMSGTFRTNRNWTYTSGGLVATGTSMQFAGALTITGSHALDAVEIAGAVTIAAGTTLTANGNVTLTSGSLSTGTLAAQANISSALGYVGGGTGTLLINGNGAQTLTGFHTTGAGSMPNVDISKPAGTLTIAGTVRTARNWTYTSGGLNATGSTLIFNGTQTVTGSHTLDTVEVRGGTLTIAAGTTLTAAGPLNLFSGTLNTGTLAAEADINVQIGYTGGGTGTLLINGGGNQTLTGFHTAATGSMPNVVINKPSGTLTIAGTVRTGRNWTYTAGALAVAGSTVIFNGTLTISGSHALNNVEFHSGDATVSAGDTLTVGGLLTLTDGNLAGGNVDVLGDVVLQAAYDGEGGTFRIAGTTDQTFTGFADTTTSDMANLVIDKPSGTLHLVGTIRMLTSSWTWVQGTVDAGTSTVYFDTTVAVAGTHSLYNVYLSGGPHTVAPGDVLTALGTLTLDNGTIDGGTIAGAGPITQLSTFDGGSGTLAITGGSSHTFAGAATTAAGNLPDLQINTSGGILTLAGTIRTANDWTHLAGLVDPDGSLVVFAGNLTVDAGPMAFNDVLVNAGTVTLADNLTTNGDLTVAAGTLAIGSHTVFAAGDVTVNAGFTATTGTLDMNGLGGQILGGTAAISLFNLTINDPAGVTQTTDVSVAGTLDLGGQLTFNGQTLSIAHAIAGAPNNLAADATSTLVIFGAGAGIVIPSSLTDLLNLTITNPNGAALAGPLTVNGILTLGSGNVDAGAFVLSIGPAGSVSRTSGHVIGRLQKWAPVGAGVTLQFEIGDATSYAPISVTFASVSVTGQLTAFTRPGEHPNIGSSPIDPALDVNRWWSLTNAGVTFTTLDATFTWVAGDVDPGASTGAFVAGKWAGSWTMPASGANTATTVTAFGLASLGEFAVGEAAADLTISKVGPAFATAGDPAGFDYTLTVHNNGPADNVTGFTVSDTLPAALTFQVLGSDPRCAAVGQAVTCTNVVGIAGGADDPFVIHVTLASTTDSGTILTNTATVASSGTNDPDSSNDSSTAVSVVVEDVQLGVSKVFSSATVTSGGASGTFTLTVTNAGDSDADNLVLTDFVDIRLTVDSVLQGPFDCSFGSGQSIDCRMAHLAAGASASVTVTYHVAASVATATVSNQADATSDEDGAMGLDSVDILTAADLADLKVGAPDPVAAGGTLTYTITVTDLGPSDALSVTLVDALDPALTGATYCLDVGSGCVPSGPWAGSVNLGTIAAGASVDVVITATVDPATPAGTIIANTASAGTTTTDPDGANNASSASTAVVPAPSTQTPTPTASGSVPDTSAFSPGAAFGPLTLLVGFVAWIVLVSGLAAEATLRRRTDGRGDRR